MVPWFEGRTARMLFSFGAGRRKECCFGWFGLVGVVVVLAFVCLWVEREKKEEDRGGLWAAGNYPRAGCLGCYGEWESRGGPNFTITNAWLQEDTNHYNYSFRDIFIDLLSPTPKPPPAELEVISDTNPFLPVVIHVSGR